MSVYIGNTEIDNPSILGGLSEIWVGNELIWQAGYPAGTVFNFDYTGTVQSIELPKGKYKLQCWGAQGGTSYGSSNGAGSKGGYSEGVLTLTEKTTLYIFVGGIGSRGSSTTLVNGGWNGGGASVGKSSYNSGDTNGYSYPACGGGATDISTVTSSMSYSGGRTNRSAASLLARCIVAGGGAGGSYRYTSVTTTTTSWNTVNSGGVTLGWQSSEGYVFTSGYLSLGAGTYKFNVNYSSTSNRVRHIIEIYDSSNNYVGYKSVGASFTANTSYKYIVIYITTDGVNNCTGWVLSKQESTSSTSTSSGYSNKSQVGGGTSGGGSYPGTQSAAGSGSQAGGFGYGANQPTTGNRYDSGAGGGGWYGGGSYTSDSNTSAVSYSGGGSGFVNTAGNASYRPSGYTGLQLDSGTTIAGNASHPSVSGGTETGHSGNGYARITVL